MSGGDGASSGAVTAVHCRVRTGGGAPAVSLGQHGAVATATTCTGVVKN